MSTIPGTTISTGGPATDGSSVQTPPIPDIAATPPPVDPLAALEAAAASARDKASVAQEAVSGAQANYRLAQDQADAAQHALYEARQAILQAVADDAKTKATDASEALITARKMAEDAMNTAREAALAVAPDARPTLPQTCPACGNIVQTNAVPGAIINCPKCDKNFPAV